MGDRPVVRIGTTSAPPRRDPLQGLKRLEQGPARLGGSTYRPSAPRGPQRPYTRRGWERRRTSWVAPLAVVAVLALVGGVAAIATLELVTLEVSGVEEGAVLRPADVRDLEVRVDAGGVAGGAVEVLVNGEPVPVEEEEGQLVARPGDQVVEGANTLAVTLEGRGPVDDLREEVAFTAFLTGPALSLPTQLRDPGPAGIVTLRGLVDDAISLEVGGQPVPIESGAFMVDLPGGSPGVVVRATDANGTTEERTVEITAEPARPAYPATRAVRIGSLDWADPQKREAVLQLAREGRINAVQLDVKEESGEIGYASRVALAQQAGTFATYYDPRDAIAQLDALGVRVIARVVCFLDPLLAGWAWENGRKDMIVLDEAGTGPLANNYGSAAFTNLANADVQQYLTDVSLEAVELGFDEILLDYIRRPEGPLQRSQFPGLVGPSDVAVARFVQSLNERLEPLGVELGVSVFGISATRPGTIAQDIRLLAPLVDYVAPMVYPSHWGPGEYGVPDPIRMPGEIVEASVADFHRVTDGSGAAVVPWLQDFTDRSVPYGAAEVRAQIDAAYRTGSEGFILWNPGSRYHAEAMDPS
jgi:hypothetical protein